MANLAKILLLLLAATQVLAGPSRPRIRGHGTKNDSPDQNEPVTLPGQDDKPSNKNLIRPIAKSEIEPNTKNLIRPHLARPHKVKPEGASFDQNEQTTCIEEAATAPPPTTCVTESANPPAPPHTDQPVTGQQFGRITHEKSIKIIIRKKGHSHGPPSPPDTPKPPQPPVPPMPPTPPPTPPTPTNTTTTTTLNTTTPTTHTPEPTTTATPPYTPLTTCIIVTTEKLMNMKECLEQARQEIKKDPIQQIGASQSQHQNQPQRQHGNPNEIQQYQQRQGPGQHPSPIQGANNPQPHPQSNSQPAQIPPQIKPLPYHRPIQKTGGSGYLNEGNEDYETHYVYEELPSPAASQQESGLGDIVAGPLLAPAEDNAGVGGVANYLYDAGGGFWNQRQ